MTPTPDLTRLMADLHGTLVPAAQSIRYVTVDTSGAGLMCLLSLLGLGILGLVMVVIWQNTWGKAETE